MEAPCRRTRAEGTTECQEGGRDCGQVKHEPPLQPIDDNIGQQRNQDADADHQLVQAAQSASNLHKMVHASFRAAGVQATCLGCRSCQIQIWADLCG